MAMNDPDHISVQAAARRRLIDLYDATGQKAFLQAAKSLARGSTTIDKADILLADGAASGRGRPAEDDFENLVAVAHQVLDNAASDHAACRAVAATVSGRHSTDATVKRLFHKLRKNREQYLGIAAWLRDLPRSPAVRVVDQVSRSLRRLFSQK